MITFAESVDFLLENGYLASVNGQITLTGKFKREFNPIPRSRIEQVFPDNPNVISRESIWKKFIEDAEIPHKATYGDGTNRSYTIRQYSPGIADKLIKVIKSVPDYKILVASTKLYYQSNGFKLILSNYISKQVWKEEYDRYEKAQKAGKMNSILNAGSGGNKFED